MSSDSDFLLAGVHEAIQVINQRLVKLDDQFNQFNQRLDQLERTACHCRQKEEIIRLKGMLEAAQASLASLQDTQM